MSVHAAPLPYTIDFAEENDFPEMAALYASSRDDALELEGETLEHLQWNAFSNHVIFKMVDHSQNNAIVAYSIIERIDDGKMILGEETGQPGPRQIMMESIRDLAKGLGMKALQIDSDPRNDAFFMASGFEKTREMPGINFWKLALK
jgi:hypothetical protein